MKFKADFKGFDELKDKLKRMRVASRGVSADAAVEAATLIKRSAQMAMRRSPASGRKYKRGDVKHTASSAGNAPRIDVGDLRKAVEVRQSKLNAKQVTVGVHSDAEDSNKKSLGERAYFLEVGTSKMEPRPFLVPALKRRAKDIKRVMNNKVKLIVKEVKK